MKVYQINTVCGVGSTGKIAAGLLKCLKATGHEGRIAWGFGEAEGTAPGETYRIVSKAGYYTHNLLSRLTGREGLFSAAATRKLTEDIRRYDPDVIHLHNLHGHYLHYEVLFRFLKEYGKPVVWTLHDCWAFTGHCPYFDAAGCGKWKTGCAGCSQYRAYPGSLTDNAASMWRRKKNCFAGGGRVVLAAPSGWLAELARNSFLHRRPVRVIPNGIDLTVFRPTESDFRKRHHCEDKILLLGVAFDWGYRKGLDVFTDLAKRLDDRYQIVLVGTNEAIDRRLPEKIISIHRTRDQRELAEVYTAADLFVNPTREDNFPTVNLEALACGTPVLTFRTGGSPEAIDESCGAVVDCGDVDALEEQIRRITAERPFGEEACVHRAARFDAAKRFEEYIVLYKEVLS